MNGPYMNEDGDWWMAVEDASFRVARDTIVGCHLAALKAVCPECHP